MDHRAFNPFAQFAIASLCGWLLLPAGHCLAQAKGSVLIDFLEQESGRPIPCRVKLTNAGGRKVPARGALVERDWNLVEGPLEFKGRPGDYRYQAWHGPQFSSASGGFTLDRNAEGVDTVYLPRHADLDQEGWFGGDMLATVDPQKTGRWLPAEDLKMAVVVSQTPLPPEAHAQLDLAGGRWVNAYSYLDSRPGSGLVLHHWMPPGPVPPSLPSSRLLVMAKESQTAQGSQPAHAEIQQLWARDVPIWLSSERVDSIQILSDHLTYDGSAAARVAPLVTPEGYFRGERGPGKIVEQLYWQVLEAGLRIPPSAGSGFGKSPSPLGYNRIYAALSSPTATSWWEAVRAGQTFVTSGPLLRVSVNSQPPGQIFDIPQGGSLELDIALTLTVSDPVEYLDVIFNGQTLYEARLDEYAKQGGRIPPLSVKEPGWLVVRVVTEREFTYRIATTAPYYFETAGQRRISRAAVAFFQQWLELAAEQISTLDETSRQGAEPYVAAARKFWLQQRDAATAD